MTVAVTGANSSVGTALLRQVATAAGPDIVALVRTAEAAASLPRAPRIAPAVIRYDDHGALAARLTPADCVVHLAGILIESETTTYRTANVDTTRAVVGACRSADVSHVVLVSTLGADAASSNGYFRSKGEAERIVLDAGLSATIIRTPLLLGRGTAGGRALVRLAHRESVRVLGGGSHHLRPLDVDDLAGAVLRCSRAPAAGVAVHELVGPETTTYRDLIVMTGRLMGREVSVGSLPIWLAKAGAVIAGWRRRGGMTPTVIDVITSDERVLHNGAADLGVTLTPLTDTLQRMLAAGEDDA